MITIHAISGDRTWNDPIVVRGRALDSACRTAARKLGLRGQIVGTERVGSVQHRVNVDGAMMMVVEVK